MRTPSPRRSALRRARNEAGYAAILVALLASTVLLGLAAIGVDTARWYVEVERVQKAADAAALAGVTYMPADLGKARTTALATAAENGYVPNATTTITVVEGGRPSELRVTISSTVHNAFGAGIGTPRTAISRTALADYTAPAPMGSPCNTFGNEPPSTTGTVTPTGSALPTSPFPNCKSNPQFWAAVEGPGTDKVQGDRYSTIPCATSTTYHCSGGKNSEARSDGYYFTVHVEPAAVGEPINVQIYDPAFVQTGVDCASIDQELVFNRMSSYTPSDGKLRYKNASSIYCSGDYLGSSTSVAPDTTFLMREQTDTGDPLKGAVIAGCTKQFAGTTTTPKDALRQWTTETGTANRTAYNPELSRVFHEWVNLCDTPFRPARAGDYYIQVRTNVALGGTAVANVNPSGRTSPSVVYLNNPAAYAVAGNKTTGVGVNSFALRAVPTSNASKSNQIAVAGFARMPILQNASSSTATFNLIRALPQTKGQYVAFDFYDVADCSSSCTGTVKVIPPTDSTGSVRNSAGVPDCKAALGDVSYTAASGCKVTVKSTTHNGQVQHMVIPIPTDYSCNPATLGGCWFSVEVNFSGANVTDITTWDANIGGDPVRLVE